MCCGRDPADTTVKHGWRCLFRRWDDRPRFALDADVTVYWPDVRPCWEPTDEQPKARTVACSWCGRSIYEADGRWLATKGKERGYDPLLCDANDDDGAHEPAVEGSSTAPGGDEGV